MVLWLTHDKATGDVGWSCGVCEGEEPVSSAAGKLFSVSDCSVRNNHLTPSICFYPSLRIFEDITTSLQRKQQQFKHGGSTSRLNAKSSHYTLHDEDQLMLWRNRIRH